MRVGGEAGLRESIDAPRPGSSRRDGQRITTVDLLARYFLVSRHDARLRAPGAAAAVAGIDSTYVSIVQFAPTITLLLFLALARTRTAALSPAAVDTWAFLLRGLLAAGVIAVYAASIVVTAFLLGATRHASPFDRGALLLAYVVLQIAGACGEELGWRGFLQPALETRMPRLAACVVTGLLWALWHVRFADPLEVVMFVLGCVALSILVGYGVTGNIWQRGFTAGIMHAVVNVALFLAVDPGFS